MDDEPRKTGAGRTFLYHFLDLLLVLAAVWLSVSVVIHFFSLIGPGEDHTQPILDTTFSSPDGEYTILFSEDNRSGYSPVYQVYYRRAGDDRLYCLGNREYGGRLPDFSTILRDYSLPERDIPFNERGRLASFIGFFEEYRSIYVRFTPLLVLLPLPLIAAIITTAVYLHKSLRILLTAPAGLYRFADLSTVRKAIVLCGGAVILLTLISLTVFRLIAYTDDRGTLIWGQMRRLVYQFFLFPAVLIAECAFFTGLHRLTAPGAPKYERALSLAGVLLSLPIPCILLPLCFADKSFPGAAITVFSCSAAWAATEAVRQILNQRSGKRKYGEIADPQEEKKLNADPQEEKNRS